MRIVKIGLFGLFLAMTPVMSEARQSDGVDVGALMLEYMRAGNDMDADRAVELGRQIRSSALFANLPLRSRADLYYRFARDEAFARHDDEVRAILAEVDAISDGSLYFEAIQYEARLGIDDWQGAANAYLRLASGAPHIAARLRMRQLNALVAGLEREGEDALLVAVLEALIPIASDPSPEWSSVGLRFTMAQALVRIGNVERAVGILETVRTPALLARIRYDRSFEFMWAAPQFDEWTNIRSATEAELVRLEGLMDDNPHYLSLVTARIEALGALGRHEEAAELGEAARQRLTTGPSFRDRADHANWLLNTHSETLLELGRVEESDIVMREAIAANEHDLPNVSQTINFAIRIMGRGDYDEATALIAGLPDYFASDFGEFFYREIEACQAFAAGDRATGTAIVENMYENWSSNPGAVAEVLACAGDSERAAAHLIRRLEHPAHRGNILRWVQSFSSDGDHDAQPDFSGRPHARRTHEFEEALLERADVMAAINAHGRILEFDVNSLIETGP